jgi:hypothetical protein
LTQAHKKTPTECFCFFSFTMTRMLPSMTRMCLFTPESEF